jgi:hypothetical protein
MDATSGERVVRLYDTYISWLIDSRARLRSAIAPAVEAARGAAGVGAARGAAGQTGP